MEESAGTIPFPGSRSQRFTIDDPNRVVRSLWIGKLSPLERLCMESFVRQGHEFQVFMYEPATDVPVGVVVRDAAEIVPATRIMPNQLGQGKGSFAAFADLFRYQMLHELGGWWVDMDVFCLQPFTFEAPYVLGAEDKPVANGVIKVPRGCEMMQRICRDARQIDLTTVLWNETGDIVGRAVADLGLMRYVLAAETFSPIVWHELPSYVRGKKRFVPDQRLMPCTCTTRCGAAKNSTNGPATVRTRSWKSSNTTPACPPALGISPVGHAGCPGEGQGSHCHGLFWPGSSGPACW